MTSPDIPPPSPAPAAGTAPSDAVWERALAAFGREYLAERRSERRWRVFFRLFWLAAFGVAVGTALYVRGQADAPSGPHTALVEVRGEIASDSEASAEILVAALKSAFADEGSRAVVIRFNSPGGSPVQAGIVNDEIRRLKAQHQKKVYAVVEEVCASGAYYIAVAADEIYTDKASVVGSIGVMMDGFGFVDTMDKLGVERRLLSAGENKSIGDPFSPMTEKHRQYTHAMLDQIHRQFIDVVKAGRGSRLVSTPETFSGLYWNGEEAVRLGLADHLGNLDYVAREVVQAEDIIDYTPKENVAERLAKRFGASVGAGAVKALRSMGTLR